MKRLLQIAMLVGLAITSTTQSQAYTDDDMGYTFTGKTSTRTVSGNFPLNSMEDQRMFIIEHSNGELTIVENDKLEISFVAEITTGANDKNSADILNSAVNIEFGANTSNPVVLKTTIDSKRTREIGSGGTNGILYQINLTIKIPRNMKIELKSEGVQAYFGLPIQSLTADTKYTIINVKQVNGTVDITSQGGEVTMDEVAGNFGVDSRYTALNIGSIKGNVGINSQYGNVAIKEAVDAAISVKYGNLTIGKIGDLRISENSYGGCTIGELTKSLVIDNIKYSALKVHYATTTEYVDINASYTDVAMTIEPGNDIITFYLSSSFAPINCELMNGFKGYSNGEPIRGSIGMSNSRNSTGPNVTVKNRYGAISFFTKAKETTTEE